MEEILDILNVKFTDGEVINAKWVSLEEFEEMNFMPIELKNIIMNKNDIFIHLINDEMPKN